MKRVARVAAVQMNAGTDKEANLQTAERLTREAAARGAELVVLPELFSVYGSLADVVRQAEPIPGPSSERLSALARELQIVLCAGSIGESAAQTGKGYNTSLLFDRDGALLAMYRKMHLFDAEIPGKVRVFESEWIAPGEEIAATRTSLGVVGQAICYDLRFPELFRALVDRAMEILCFPSAFTAATGRDHWEVLLRARAIENACYIIAANQFGLHGASLASYGGSLIIDPWGEVLACAPLDAEAVLVADLHDERLQQVRAQLPALRHRRL